MPKQQSADLTVPGLPGFVRLGGTPETLVDSLGPLANLIGTWVGNFGWNVIAVPKVFDGRLGFELLVRPYYETITFAPIGAPVPDRGGAKTLFLTGLHYDLRVTDSQTNQPLHIENGLWLFLNQVDLPGGPSIVRQAAIPHGNSVLAMGGWSVTQSAPKIPDINALPFPVTGAPQGYTEPYRVTAMGSNFQAVNPNKTLQDAIKKQKIVETTTLWINTQPQGGIVNIPFIKKNANATAFNGTFWIELVENKDGTKFEQLQYTQQTNIEFIPQFDNPKKLITWPHVNVNTLVKQ
jgi:hypothetical protein